MDPDIELYRREYARQRKLENIVTKRRLNRPNISRRQVTTLFVGLPLLLFAATFPCAMYAPGPACKTIFSVTAVAIIGETYLRLCLIAAVKLYQKTAKEETRRRCKCIPSCSEYAVLALKRVFPLAAALLKIRKRLKVTCDGDEYKVDFPTKRMGQEFERKLCPSAKHPQCLSYYKIFQHPKQANLQNKDITVSPRGHNNTGI